MSSQGGILSKFHSSRLWTRPSKDQYLPAYFKQVCDEYMASECPHRVFPVEVGKHAIRSLFNVLCLSKGSFNLLTCVVTDTFTVNTEKCSKFRDTHVKTWKQIKLLLSCIYSALA